MSQCHGVGDDRLVAIPGPASPIINDVYDKQRRRPGVHAVMQNAIISNTAYTKHFIL